MEKMNKRKRVPEPSMKDLFDFAGCVLPADEGFQF